MKNDRQNIFLTGITGTLGTDLVRELLTTTQNRLFLLARPKNGMPARERIRKILEAKGLDSIFSSRVEVLEGDVTLPRLGLSEAVIRGLEKEIDVFFHVAALTALNGSREDCMRINYEGTVETLRLADDLWRQGRLKRFFYFSTAFVAGSRQNYCSPEDGLPERPAHANYYESSKYMAESKVREAMRTGFPATIFRPSIVVGHSETGEVSDFNVIYPFLKLFAHGLLAKLPTNLENSFNIVPIDFVIRASLAIAGQEKSLGKTYHLVTSNPPTIGMLLRLKAEEYPRLPPIEIIAPEHFVKEDLPTHEQMIFSMLEPYLGYLNDHLTFDTRNTEAALAGTGILMPRTDYEFLKIILRYAVGAGYLLVE